MKQLNNYLYKEFEKIDEMIQTCSRYLPFTYQRVIRTSIDNGSVLDIGCGEGWTWRFCINRPKIDHFLTVGVDMSPEYLAYCKSKELYKELVLCNARNLPFGEKSFDIVLLSQLIEHLEKKDALELIGEAEKIAKKMVIIGTPVGFLRYDFHLSGWEPTELIALGYTVSGHGLRVPLPEGKLLMFCSQFSRFTCLFPFTYRRPQIAYQMVAKKMIAKDFAD